MTQAYCWTDHYRLFLLQLYLRKPVGIKPLYSRPMIELCLELHIPPRVLFAKMCDLALPSTPSMERLWQRYGTNTRRLGKAVAKLRGMRGFGAAVDFYDGVELNETWEKDYRPVCDGSRITPLGLTLTLDLYFRLTPATMVPETPEVQELARLMGATTAEVADILDIYQHIDPYMERSSVVFSPMLSECQRIWNRYAGMEQPAFAAIADSMKDYFR